MSNFFVYKEISSPKNAAILNCKISQNYKHYRPPDKSAYWKIIFLFLNQNICCGYSKEPSQ